MKTSGGATEDGIVVGNAYDKYGSRNPIVKKIMENFHSSLSDMVSLAAPDTIHEIGCGEGYWVIKWLQEGYAARGSDFSNIVIGLAKENADSAHVSANVFSQKSIYDIQLDTDDADLVVCCEVFEHLEDPDQAIEALASNTTGYVLLSVPREPIWRTLNLARGKYVSDLGNTPGHIQHWSKTSFTAFVGKHFDIVASSSPLPWTMLLCKHRKGAA